MESETDELWKPCPPGTFARMESSMKTRRRRRQAARVAMSLMLVGVGIAGWAMTIRNSENDYGGIVCSEVRRLAPGYLSGELDEDTSRKIAVHFGLCPTCGPTMQKMRESMHVLWTPCSDPGCQHCSQSAALASVEDITTNAIDRFDEQGDTSLAFLTQNQRLLEWGRLTRTQGDGLR